MRLERNRRRVPRGRRHREPLPQPGRAEVGKPDVADLPRLLQLVEHADRFVERHVGVVVAVHVVQVDVVGLQPGKRRVGRREHVRPGQPPGLRAPADLGRDDDRVPVAPRGDPFADHRLRLPADVPRDPGRIGVSGVDVVAAGGDERVEHRERRLLVRRPAERVAAKPEREHVKVRTPDNGHR